MSGTGVAPVKKALADDNVAVIVDRRHADRRGRAGTTGAVGPDGQRRVVRDRRRARVPGELPALAGTVSS